MSAHRSSEQGAFVGLTSAKALKPSALKLAARTGLNLDRIKRVADLAAAGRTSQAVRVADSVHRDIERNQIGQVVCGPQPPRDWRRPIVAEYHELASAAFVAGDVIAAIQGTANFLPTATPAQRRFLQCSEAPVAGAIMRPAILGRTLMGISAKFQLCIQPTGGLLGPIGAPDTITSNLITDMLYTYQCQIFPSSSAEPLMDSTPLEYWRGGRMLPQNVESPVVNDAFNILVLQPGNANAVGSVALPVVNVDFAFFINGYVSIAGLFVNGVG